MKKTDGVSIALVANTSWSIYNFRKGLIDQLLRQGFNVFIIAPHDEYQDRLAEMGCKTIPTPLRNYSINPIWDLVYFIQLLRIFKKHQINFIISFTIKPNIYGSLAARVLGIPILALITGLGHLFIKHSWKTYIARLLYTFSLKKAAQIWFLNREDQKTFVDLSIVKKVQTKVLPSEGVNTQFFKSNQYAGRSPQFSFLFAGRLMAEKGIYEYVEAARLVKERFPEVQFHVLGFIGEGFPHAISLSQMKAWQEEEIIIYHGATDNIRAYLDQVDCVVLPTYYKEGVPRILLEAASMELPIITTDNVGCREVVKHDINGFICKSQDAASLAYWMEKVVSCSAIQREKMGRFGRQLVIKKFDEQLIIKYYLRILEEYLKLPPLKFKKAITITQSGPKIFALQNKYRNFPNSSDIESNSKTI